MSRPLSGIVIGIATAILLFCGGLAIYLLRGGLDFYNPASAREWIKVCARSRADVYCNAAAHVLQETSGPVVFLRPNTGVREINAALNTWKGQPPTREEVEAIARANLFAASDLMTGTVRSLDGQVRKVACSTPDQRTRCRIGHLSGWRYTQPDRAEDGAVYLVVGPKGEMDFFPPRARSPEDE